MLRQGPRLTASPRMRYILSSAGKRRLTPCPMSHHRRLMKALFSWARGLWLRAALISIASRPTTRTRAAARSASERAIPGCIYACAARAVTSVAAMIRRTVTPPSISTRHSIPSSRRSSLANPGAGASPTSCFSTLCRHSCRDIGRTSAGSMRVAAQCKTNNKGKAPCSAHLIS